MLLFGATGAYLEPQPQGVRLWPDGYLPLELIGDRLRSERLGLDLVQDGEQLRLYEPVTAVSEKARAWDPAAGMCPCHRDAPPGCGKLTRRQRLLQRHPPHLPPAGGGRGPPAGSVATTTLSSAGPCMLSGRPRLVNSRVVLALSAANSQR